VLAAQGDDKMTVITPKAMLDVAKWLEETNPITGEQELRQMGLLDAAERCLQRRNGYLLAIEHLKSAATHPRDGAGERTR
jgi:hypothetical protein